MSNYLIVVANSAQASLIAEKLRSEKGFRSEDIASVEIAEDRILTYVAKQASGDLSLTERFLFRGFAIDYANRRIMFGTSGFEQSNSTSTRDDQKEGNYLLARWDDTRVSISRDLFGISAMLHTAGPGFAAVSDSLLVLSWVRAALGLPTTLNEDASIARSWLNSMAGQLISEETSLEEVRYAQPGTGLEIDFRSDLTLNVKRRDIADIFALDGQSHRSTIRYCAQRIASLVQSLAGFSLNSLRIALSGGSDSRVCLAAALLSPVARQQTSFNCINTSSFHARDYEVVQELSKAFNFQLGLRSDEKGHIPHRFVTTPVHEPIGLWALANAGVYDFLYLPKRVTKSVGIFNISGHGAEILKGNYGWRPISKIAKNIVPSQVSASFQAQAERALQSAGIDSLDPSGSEWHYLLYRNALHSRQFAVTSMVGFRPYMMRELVGLSRSADNEYPAPKHGAPSIVSDLLITLSPALAKCGFDDETKNMTSAYVDGRSAELGSSLSQEELDKFAISGSPLLVQNGFPQVFMGIAEGFGFCVAPTRENILHLSRSGMEKISSSAVRAAYESVMEDAVVRLGDETTPLTFTRAAAGKLMSFNILSA